MNSLSFVCATGAIAYTFYQYRYKLATIYYNCQQNGFRETISSMMIPEKAIRLGDIELITFSHGGHIYHYPIKANADKTASIGYKLYVRCDDVKIDITPPAGFMLGVSGSDFGPDYELIVEHDHIETVYNNDETINWPIEHEIEVEE